MAVQKVLLGRTVTTSRFPRYGYLDKFHTNQHMAKSLLVSSAIFLGGIGAYAGYQAYQEWRTGKQASHQGERKKVRVLQAADLGVPPSLTPQQTTSVKVDVKTRPKVAMPKPVPDDQAVEETIAASDDYAIGQLDMSDGLGDGDSLVIDSSGWGLPGADEYVAFEKAPELVSMESPLYPDIAREAGVEGTILVRVLVGEDGFVKDMVIIQSIPMLDEPAADAAWTAVFKPALQKDRPVAVWMVIPLEFSLRG
jgi:protein TonB